MKLKKWTITIGLAIAILILSLLWAIAKGKAWIGAGVGTFMGTFAYAMLNTVWEEFAG